jgi:uncharacterized protein YbjT (DUF2867 family)
MKTSILVAGAGGAAGTHLLQELSAQGLSARLFTRNKQALQRRIQSPALQFAHSDNAPPLAEWEIREGDALRPATLENVCSGIDVVVSSIGASLSLNNWNDKNSFQNVDYYGNKNLLKEAQKSGVQKFVYLSSFMGETMDTAYTKAHENFVQELKNSGLEYVVVRPTGFFYVNLEFLSMARKGFASLVGNGRAKTNPIHEQDVARACLTAALHLRNEDMPIGGPDIFTRQEIVELAFAALAKKPRIMHAPVAATAIARRCITPLNRRIGELVEFLGYVSVHECVAPLYGKQRLAEYFAEAAKKL